MWALSGTGRDSVTENRSTKTAGDVMRANGNATPRHRSPPRAGAVSWRVAMGWGGRGRGRGSARHAPEARRGAASAPTPLAAPENATATAPVHPP